MNYEEAVEYLDRVQSLGSRPGLESIGRLLELMGNPQKKLKFIHVAGTNGKGSTVAFISSILREAGLRTGAFTSPFLVSYSEMIRVNGTKITNDSLARIITGIEKHINLMTGKGGPHPTQFEIMTAAAFQYFLETGCDAVVLEVGLGGRLDATNIIDTPLVSVLTTISYDHTGFLGETLAKIAYEKAGIIKPGGDVVMHPQASEAEAVVIDTCSRMGAELRKVDLSSLKLKNRNVDGQEFDFESFIGLSISLIGEHQLRNAATAVKTAEFLRNKGFHISEEAIRSGLEKARWPGRLEVLGKNPLFLIDGAHNMEGVLVLRQTLDQYFPKKRRIFLVGVLKDKDYVNMMETVISPSCQVVAVTPGNPRALPAEQLAKIISNYCKNVQVSDTIERAVRTCLDNALPDDLICAFGSLYCLGEIRSFFGKYDD